MVECNDYSVNSEPRHAFLLAFLKAGVLLVEPVKRRESYACKNMNSTMNICCMANHHCNYIMQININK